MERLTKNDEHLLFMVDLVSEKAVQLHEAGNNLDSIKYHLKKLVVPKYTGAPNPTQGEK